MSNYSLTVALFDFAPILVSAIAYGLLTTMVTYGQPRQNFGAWTGVALITAGGLCKASWKLLGALDLNPPAWLGNLLLPLMAPGLIVIYVGLQTTIRGNASGPTAKAVSSPTIVVLFLAALTSGLIGLLLPHSHAWFIGLLITTVATNTILVLQLAMISLRAGQYANAACFFYNACSLLILGGLSKLPAATGSAWLQEGINLSAQGALASGVWLMSRNSSKYFSRTNTILTNTS